ncbi:MAG TPA: hypothetical protein VFR27_17470 [Mycobacterium sp.]|nr:hypothetical protein [Mycobacterium sp.]
MDQVARRYTAAAAAVTAVAGLIAAVPTVSPSLPDVQVRATDLTANVSDLQGSEITALYEHVQQEFSGPSDAVQSAIGPGDLFADQNDLGLGGGSPTLNIDDLTLDENSLNNLIGAGFDPTIFQGPPITAIDPATGNVFDGNTSSGLFGANDQSVAAAASFISITAADVLPGLQAAYQSMTEGLVTAEMAYNSALVDTQLATVDRFFGTDNPASDFINWVLSLNNTSLAQAETAVNSLLGANFDPDAIQGSLVTALNSDGFTLSDWAGLLGISPDDLSQIVSAAEGSNLFGLLGGMDLGSLFQSIF